MSVSRLDQIEDYWLDGAGAILDADISWLIALARRLLAVEEAAPRPPMFNCVTAKYVQALADLDEWRREQP